MATQEKSLKDRINGGRNRIRTFIRESTYMTNKFLVSGPCGQGTRNFIKLTSIQFFEHQVWILLFPSYR